MALLQSPVDSPRQHRRTRLSHIRIDRVALFDPPRRQSETAVDVCHPGVLNGSGNAVDRRVLDSFGPLQQRSPTVEVEAGNGSCGTHAAIGGAVRLVDDLLARRPASVSVRPFLGSDDGFAAVASDDAAFCDACGCQAAAEIRPLGDALSTGTIGWLLSERGGGRE